MEAPTSPLDREVLGGLAVFRAVAWVWTAVVLVVTRADLAHPAVATALVAAALVLTVALGGASRRAPGLLLRPGAVVLEVAVGGALLVADEWVYGGAHRVSLGTAWPLAGVMTAGIALGPAAGAAAGVAVGLGRYGGTHLDALGSPGALSLLSTTFLYALAGAAAGLVVGRLRRAEDAIAAARAREEVARTLHDGVLQTLAVVQRRAADPELAALAQAQERELRAMLLGIDRPPGDLLAELRRVAARAEARHGLAVEVTVVEEPGPLAAPLVQAAAGAVGEALANAAKHGAAGRAVVFVDPGDDGWMAISVDDDGDGFDVEATPEGVGLSRSIRGRLADVGGRAEVRSAAGRGTEVRLLLPT
ncbi:MAG TPA: ATP-binding protein [Acidimicrobiales bacterium]|nr:ATP-binding protein [Acidimicrobiales bacterium]